MNPTAFPRKLKIAPATLPTIAGNASTAFPANRLSAFASLSNYFFKTPLSFGGELPAPPPSLKALVMGRTTVEIVIETAVSIENMVMPSSRNKVRAISANDVYQGWYFEMLLVS